MLGPAPLITLTRQRDGLVAGMLLQPPSLLMPDHVDLHAAGHTRTVEIAADDRGPQTFDVAALGWAFGEASGLIVAESVYAPADLVEVASWGRWWSTSPGFVVGLHVSSAQKARWLEFARSYLRPDTLVHTLSAGCALNSAFPTKRSH